MTTLAAVERSYTTLKYGYGITLVLIGLDKLLRTNLIADWDGYVSGLALAVLPLSAGVIVAILGLAEIAVGGMILGRLVRQGALLAIATLIIIIANLFSLGLYDIAARDALIALGLLVLIWLTDARRASVLTNVPAAPSPH